MSKMTKERLDEIRGWTTHITFGGRVKDLLNHIDAVEEELENSRLTLATLHQKYLGSLDKLDQLRGALEEADFALKHASEFCLCNRNTVGFDYSEEHTRMGKPKVGARWLTPKDVVDPARDKIARLLGEQK